MSKKQQPVDLRTQKMNMNAEAVRSGLFASTMDIAELMKANNVDDASAAILDGAVLFVAELWDNTMFAAGHSPSKSRKALLAGIGDAVTKARAKRADQLQADVS